MTTQVFVLSNQAEDGLLWSGRIEIVLGDEPLAAAVLRELRDQKVGVSVGDLLFFPDASPGHRAIEVGEHDSFVRHHGWELRANRFYECAHGHQFGVVVETEPEQYVVKCPVCGTTTVKTIDRS